MPDDKPKIRKLDTPLTEEQKRLAADHLLLAYWATRRAVHRSRAFARLSDDDVQGAAHMAAVHAARNYDPERGNLSTLMGYCALHALHLAAAGCGPVRRPVNLLSDATRQAAARACRWRGVDYLALRAAPGATPAEEAEHADWVAAVWRAVDALPEPHRSVLLAPAPPAGVSRSTHDGRRAAAAAAVRRILDGGPAEAPRKRSRAAAASGQRWQGLEGLAAWLSNGRLKAEAAACPDWLTAVRRALDTLPRHQREALLGPKGAGVSAGAYRSRRQMGMNALLRVLVGCDVLTEEGGK